MVLPGVTFPGSLFSPLPAPPRLPRVFPLPLFSFAPWQFSRGSQVSRCYSWQAAAYSLKDCSHTHSELFHFTYQAASRSNNPQSLPPFDQSLRQSRLGTLNPLRRRTLPRRIRHTWTASRCSSLFHVVGFAGRAPFLVALHRIVPRWRIRTQTPPPAYHRFNGVGLRTCNSCLDFLLLSGVPGQFFFFA